MARAVGSVLSAAASRARASRPVQPGRRPSGPTSRRRTRNARGSRRGPGDSPEGDCPTAVAGPDPTFDGANALRQPGSPGDVDGRPGVRRGARRTTRPTVRTGRRIRPLPRPVSEHPRAASPPVARCSHSTTSRLVSRLSSTYSQKLTPTAVTRPAEPGQPDGQRPQIRLRGGVRSRSIPQRRVQRPAADRRAPGRPGRRSGLPRSWCRRHRGRRSRLPVVRDATGSGQIARLAGRPGPANRCRARPGPRHDSPGRAEATQYAARGRPHHARPPRSHPRSPGPPSRSPAARTR